MKMQKNRANKSENLKTIATNTARIVDLGRYRPLLDQHLGSWAGAWTKP